jgi:Tol biopolymer transport system component
MNPVWTPDGTRITFTSYNNGSSHLLSKPADGSGAEQVGAEEVATLTPQSWSPDGQVLTLSGLQPSTRSWDIWMLSGDGKPSPFLQTRFTESSGTLSPDGRWLAYVSNESGGYQVYVQPFPSPGRKWQVSTDGGTQPVWARNRRELFYRNGRKMMAVDITTGPAFAEGNPKVLFEADYELGATVFAGQYYDVTPDGQHFIMVRGKETTAASNNPFMSRSAQQINVVLNWFEELAQHVPRR